MTKVLDKGSQLCLFFAHEYDPISTPVCNLTTPSNAGNGPRKLNHQRHAEVQKRAIQHEVCVPNICMIRPLRAQDLTHTSTTSGCLVILLYALEMSIPLLMLFQEQECCHCMRPQPHETRQPPSKHPPSSLHPVNFCQQLYQPFALLGTHHPRLDHVHRTTDGGCDKARKDAGGEVRSQIVR